LRSERDESIVYWYLDGSWWIRPVLNANGTEKTN
jgi:hypothetical protein